MAERPRQSSAISQAEIDLEPGGGDVNDGMIAPFHAESDKGGARLTRRYGKHIGRCSIAGLSIGMAGLFLALGTQPRTPASQRSLWRAVPPRYAFPRARSGR